MLNVTIKLNTGMEMVALATMTTLESKENVFSNLKLNIGKTITNGDKNQKGMASENIDLLSESIIINNHLTFFEYKNYVDLLTINDDKIKLNFS